MEQISYYFMVELSVSAHDGFLGSPLGLRSSTRACSTGLPLRRPNHRGLVSPMQITIKTDKNNTRDEF